MDLVQRLTPAVEETLCSLSGLLMREGIPFAVVGATAFLLQDSRFIRGTRDLDLAIATTGGVAAIRSTLLENGLQGTDTEHRFRVPGGMDVDVLGFDPDWEPSHEIPQRLGGTISAAGVPESITHALPLTLGACETRIAPLHLLIATKLGTSAIPTRRDDLEDALYAMLSFEETGTRRFELDYDSYGTLEIEIRGALLAGLDAGKQLLDESQTAILQAIDVLLEDPRLRDRQVEDHDALDLVTAFRRGLLDGATSTVS